MTAPLSRWTTAWIAFLLPAMALALVRGPVVALAPPPVLLLLPAFALVLLLATRWTC